MLEPAKLAAVHRLLAEGSLSQRKIAAATGVSRGSVAAIAAGRRPDYEERARRQQAEDLLGSSSDFYRCPGCGGKVRMPCRACHLRDVAPMPSGPEATCDLELRLGHQERYEEMRAPREAAEAANE